MRRKEYTPVVVKVPIAVSDYINQLARIGVYGRTADEIIAYLVQRGLDDLLRAGVLSKGSIVR